ncbi:MAG: hypothetical protein ACI91B_000534 [Planctomycetota bacterium]|jgi:hypothetical protein
MQSPKPRRKKSSRRRRFLFKSVVLLFVSVVCVGILEIGVRMLAPQAPSWLRVYRSHPRLPMALEANAHAIVDTGETRWEVWTDEQGHRRAGSPVQDDRPTALWLGDSFLFGHGVNHEETWVGRLDAQQDGRFRHMNHGVPGYGPTHYEIVLDEALNSEGTVSMVFVATYLGNDFHDTIWLKNNVIRGGVVGNDGSFKSWLQRNLHSYRLTARVAHRLGGRVAREESALTDLRTPAAWKVSPMRDAIRKYTDAMAGIARACAKRSIPLVVVVIPSVGMVVATRDRGAVTSADTPDERGTLFRALSILQGLDVRVIDTTPTLAKHDPDVLYFSFDGHFSPLGHQVVGDLVLRDVPELQK